MKIYYRLHVEHVNANCESYEARRQAQLEIARTRRSRGSAYLAPRSIARPFAETKLLQPTESSVRKVTTRHTTNDQGVPPVAAHAALIPLTYGHAVIHRRTLATPGWRSAIP